jgi:hypothetical protein
MTAAFVTATDAQAHALAAEYHRARGASGRWTRADGAEITLDTYQPAYTARRPDGSTFRTWSAIRALEWIGPTPALREWWAAERRQWAVPA